MLLRYAVKGFILLPFSSSSDCKFIYSLTFGGCVGVRWGGYIEGLVIH